MTEEASAFQNLTEPVEDDTALDIDLDRASIPQLRLRMERGGLDAVGLTEAYLERIRALNPLLRAVLFVDPTALDQARASDRRRRDGQCAGPLDGIPVLVKDSVETAGLGTTAGSLALRGVPPARDAELVRRLRNAGAVILGKTNLSEWSNFRSADSVSGWSAVGGQTVNPHVLDRSPGGSSSGSTAGVAAALAQVAIGTETDGSIIGPAGMAGVVGCKPTLGLVSRSGIVPISAEQDTPGPIARNTTDAALALSVLQGRDPADPATRALPADGGVHGFPPRSGALRGARIGLWQTPAAGDPVQQVLAKSAELLRQEGAEVIDVDLPYQQLIGELHLSVLLGEFRRDIHAYLGGRAGGPRDLAGLIEYTSSDPRERACFDGQELFRLALAAPDPRSPQHRARRAELADYARRSIDEVLAAHQLSAIATVSNPVAWRIESGDEKGPLMSTTTPAAVAGYPSVTVPAGFVGPLPVGLSLIAGRWADARVLALAHGFEQAADARRPPRYRRTVAGI
ncbi:MAG: amidase family protein [Nocardiopsaceae bacterium]|nr:amidase family protein [Nocardiopsaceae bacterium]